jgi:hypothetical protein
MMNKRIKAVILVTLASFVLLAGAQPGGESVAERAKAWNAEIEAMIGQPPQPVLDKLLSWKLDLIAAWKTEDPNSSDFKKLNKGKTRFTKKEIADLLVPGPTYKIAFYGFLVGTEAATTGYIDEQGRGVDKDASYTVRIYTVIRVVFKDDKLVQVRTWPKVDSSQVSGGTWRQR